MADNRKNSRFIVKENTFTALGDGFIQVCGVKDISTGGLAFEYVTKGDARMDKFDHLDIFVSGNGFHLRNVPCNMVYDVTLDPEQDPAFFSLPVTAKRCGVRFDTLTHDQQQQLNNLLADKAVPL